MINAIHLKRLKRKRKLCGRVQCHGNKYACSGVHSFRKPKPVHLPEAMVNKKVGFFERIINWFKSFFMDNRDVKY